MAKFDVAKLIRIDGRHVPPDGRGLSLYVRGNSALWVRQYRDPVTHKTRAKSLGSAKGPNALNLTQARDACYAHRLNGTAPADRRIVTGKTFGEVMDLHIADMGTRPNGSGWKGGLDGKEAKAYRRLLKTSLAAIPVAAIDTQAIAEVLKPMPALTAERHRGRVEAVLDRATSMGLRSGENPAAKKIMKSLLTPPPDAKHHRALAAANLPALMKELAAINSAASRALRFTVLTAARTEETRGAKWEEIFPKGAVVLTADGSTDETLADDTWIVPARRAKEGREHRVPLIPEMSVLLGDRGEPSDLIFGVMGTNAMLDLLKRLRPGHTVHGLRSTFTDWAAKRGYSMDLRETALAHALGDPTNRAYQRDELAEERRPMMQAWSAFAGGVP